MANITNLILCTGDKSSNSIRSVKDLRQHAYSSYNIRDVIESYILVTESTFANMSLYLVRRTQSCTVGVHGSKYHLGVICMDQSYPEVCIHCNSTPRTLIVPIEDSHYFLCQDCYLRMKLRGELIRQ